MASPYPKQKTKTVCTIGPASRSRPVLKRMIRAGMNVARLNFSHGSLQERREDIASIRAVAGETNRDVSILADLPGPKIRIGTIEGGSCILKKGDRVILTTEQVTGSPSRITVLYPDLPGSVRPGSKIFLNDGFIQMRVREVQGSDVLCTVITGGRLLSGKGLNLPGSELALPGVTDKDLELTDFALGHGIRVFGISFVRSAEDVRTVREHALNKGEQVFLIAKIERSDAIRNIEEILDEADGIMIARGDLGVEIPIEQVPVVQKQLIFRANLASKPVITATQMLESMTHNIRPTRAEATDVANAILDGTDAVMLSEETAIGTYPVETLEMMNRIARSTEKQREDLVSGRNVTDALIRVLMGKEVTLPDLMSIEALTISRTIKNRCIVCPATSGATARRVSRFKPASWIIALCRHDLTAEYLRFSYGVLPHPIFREFRVRDSVHELKAQGFLKEGERMIVMESTSDDHGGDEQNLRMVRIP